jgi:hypothetical protein
MKRKTIFLYIEFMNCYVVYICLFCANSFTDGHFRPEFYENLRIDFLSGILRKFTNRLSYRNFMETFCPKFYENLRTDFFIRNFSVGMLRKYEESKRNFTVK